MKYFVKKNNLYLYKIKSNDYAYFSDKKRAKLFSKKEAIKLAKQHNGEIENE